LRTSAGYAINEICVRVKTILGMEEDNIDVEAVFFVTRQSKSRICFKTWCRDRRKRSGASNSRWVVRPVKVTVFDVGDPLTVVPRPDG